MKLHQQRIVIRRAGHQHRRLYDPKIAVKHEVQRTAKSLAAVIVEPVAANMGVATSRFVWCVRRKKSVVVPFVVYGIIRDSTFTMSELLGIELGFPIRIYLWSSPKDAAGVERVESETFEEQIDTLGTRVLADLVHVFTIDPWIVTHELTHVLTKEAGERVAGTLPAWLNEGTATYAEADWRSRRGPAITRAVENDDVLSVRSMGSDTSTPGDVDLFYGQSADIVTFLIDRFGEVRFARLFAVFREGSTVDNALQMVYGLDRDGLDTAYRENLGLDPRVVGEDRSTQIKDDPIAPAGTTQTVPAPLDEAPAGGVTDTDAVAPRLEERDPAEIATRRVAVERWNSTLRLGPSFGPSGGFPWEELVTGLGSGALLVSLILLILVLRSGTPWTETASCRTAPPPSSRDEEPSSSY